MFKLRKYSTYIYKTLVVQCFVLMRSRLFSSWFHQRLMVVLSWKNWLMKVKCGERRWFAGKEKFNRKQKVG